MNNAPSVAWDKAYPPVLRNYRVDLSSLPTNAAALSSQAASQHQDRAAFCFVLPGEISVARSFKEVDALSDAFAAYLVHEAGLAPGQVVAIQLPTSLHYPIAVFGAWKAGLIVTNVNPMYTERELHLQLKDSGAQMLLASDLFLQAAGPVAATLGINLLTASMWDFFDEPVATMVREKLAAAAPAGSTPAMPSTRMSEALSRGLALGKVSRRDHPIALYQYTGGTTGRSKGAVITHQNILATLRMTGDFLNAYDGPRSGETILTVLPLYHIFAFMVNFLVFYVAGARNLLVPNPRPVSCLQSTFENFQIEWMSGVDTLYAGLLAEPWFKAKPPKLRFAFSGGTALRPSTAQAWQASVCPILEGYGMTETTCIVSCNPPTQAPHIGTVGLPMPGCEVRIVDADGKILGPGMRGELLVRGPQVCAGYLRADGETANAFVDGWLHTGDIALVGSDGYVRIVDRKKDMILVSGFNVYPNEIEDVLAGHPGIVEAAVVGVPDSATGEAVRAFVVVRNTDLNTADIENYCRTQLAAYKVPRQILFRDQLPKSPVGKILRSSLRELT